MSARDLLEHSVVGSDIRCDRLLQASFCLKQSVDAAKWAPRASNRAWRALSPAAACWRTVSKHTVFSAQIQPNERGVAHSIDHERELRGGRREVLVEVMEHQLQLLQSFQPVSKLRREKSRFERNRPLLQQEFLGQARLAAISHSHWIQPAFAIKQQRQQGVRSRISGGRLDFVIARAASIERGRAVTQRLAELILIRRRQWRRGRRRGQSTANALRNGANSTHAQ